MIRVSCHHVGGIVQSVFSSLSEIDSAICFPAVHNKTDFQDFGPEIVYMVVSPLIWQVRHEMTAESTDHCIQSVKTYFVAYI